MDIEYEATFLNIDQHIIRQKLQKIGAKQIYPEYLQKRVVFDLPKGHEIKNGWLRVRQEYDKVTLSLKVISGNKIADQKEICLNIDNFDAGITLLNTMGCIQKSYQENKRELWKYHEVEICIDEWPYIEPYVEIEGQSETEVKKVAALLEFDYSAAYFGAVDAIISQKYNISVDIINNHTPRIVFGEKNPYLR